jgi:hypothetical protein
VHGLPSSQSRSSHVRAVQIPASHMAGSPSSSQGVALATGALAQTTLTESQESAVHGLPSSQATSSQVSPKQLPALHIPGWPTRSQIVPSDTGTLSHVAPLGSQVSVVHELPSSQSRSSQEVAAAESPQPDVTKQKLKTRTNKSGFMRRPYNAAETSQRSCVARRLGSARTD